MLNEMLGKNKYSMYHLYVESKKFSKLNRSRLSCRGETGGSQWGNGSSSGMTGVGEWEETIRCKTGFKDVLYDMGNIVNALFCNNCKWKVTFKNCIRIKNLEK